MSGASKTAAKRTRFVFTDSALKRLPSMVKKDTDYYDEKTPGLICRVLQRVNQLFNFIVFSKKLFLFFIVIIRC